MKKNNFKWMLVALVGLFIGFASCSDDDDEPLATLTVDPATVNLAVTGESKTVNITTNQMAWSAACVVMEDTVWCKVKVVAGKLTIGATENILTTNRTAKIKVIAGSGMNVANKEITVAQEGAAPATLTVDPATVNLAVTGESQQVNITTNQMAWSAACVVLEDTVWCKVKVVAGKLTIGATANILTTERTTKVKVVAGTGMNTAEKEITVTQEKAKEVLYKLLDVYDKDGVKGIVYKITEGGKHGMIVSATQIITNWASQSAASKDLNCRNYDDGLKNVEIMKGQADWTTKYPAAAWCDALNTGNVTGWYMPAKNELKEVAALYINNTAAFNTASRNAGGVDIVEGSWEGWDPKYASPVKAYYASTEGGRSDGDTEFVIFGPNSTSPSKTKTMKYCREADQTTMVRAVRAF
ncbi:MAG: BACON domain-containing protein [Odoribacter sp.]